MALKNATFAEPVEAEQKNGTVMHKNKIGIYGFGCVGQGLFDVLSGANNDVGVSIAKICVRDRSKPRKIDMSNFTFDEWEIFEKGEANFIVELINSPEEAFEIVSRALNNKKSVVTANKKLVAMYFNQLYDLQKRNGVAMLYEAACCASIPIIRTLEEYFDNEELKSIKGIFNGTTNFILTRMYNQGWTYEEALSHAQKEGFAELDPTSDVEGFDAKYKLAILCAHAFGTFVDPDKFVNLGIANVSPFDFQYAREKGLKLKLIPQGVNENGKLSLYVTPKFVTPENPLYNVENEYNGVLLEGKYSGKQFLSGKGAGGYATGSAVLSDISALNYEYKYSYKKMNLPTRPAFSNDYEIKVYLRYEKDDLLSLVKIKDITQKFESNEYKYVIGTVNLKDVMKLSEKRRSDYFLAEMP